MSKFGRIMISGIITSAILMTACGKQTNTNVNGHIEEEVEVVYPEEETATDTNNETTDLATDTTEVSDTGTEGEVELNEETIKEMLGKSSEDGLSDEEWDRVLEYVRTNYTREELKAKILESLYEKYDKTLNYEEYYGEITGNDDHFYDIHCEAGVTTWDDILAQLPGSELAEYVDYVAITSDKTVKMDKLDAEVISEFYEWNGSDLCTVDLKVDAKDPFLGCPLSSKRIITLTYEKNDNGDFVITEIKSADISDFKEDMEEITEEEINLMYDL